MKKFFFRIIFSVLLVLTAGIAQAQNIQFDSNVSQSLRAQVMDDFKFLQTIQSAKESPIHQATFGKLDGTNYLQWFNKRVLYFGFGCGIGGTAVACVKPQYANKIWVTSNYSGIDHPQIARLMTLFHEARHTEAENGNWSHAKCPGNFPHRSIWTGARLNGNYACDSTEFGSYSSASVMLNNISRFCANCTDKVKADAKLFSDDQVKRVIDAQAAARLKTDFGNKKSAI